MNLRSFLFFLLPLAALPLAAEDQNTTSPAAAPVLTGPLQLQENPVPPPAPPAPSPTPSATPDPAATSPAAAPVVPADTNAAAPTNNPYVPGPAPASGEPAAPAPDSGMGSPGQNPPPSDPNSLIPPPQEALPPSPINTAGNEEKQRQDQKVRYYTAKVKADKEEALSSLLEQADKAKSDEEKRQALREYYDLLAKRMKKIDSSLSDWIDTMHAAYLRRMEQVRVEPTIPMNLPPTPATSEGANAAASPTPSPTPGHRRKKKVVAVESPSPSASPKKKAAAPSDN